MQLAAETLLEHLTGWLLVQPEWALFMGSAPRAQRRQLGALIGRYITTIPARDGEGEPNREQRRAIVQQLARMTEWR